MSLVEQMSAFRGRFPDFRVVRGKRGQVSWIGELTPLPHYTATYKVKVVYELGQAPKVFVLEPELKPREDASIPHRYGDGSLCLYLPGSEEWTPSKPIAQTIVPWACLWFYYYEVWHAIGEWEGGGMHPIPPSQLSRYQSNPLRNE
jgi:hypothetical protein